jgi:hypothetical protein
MDTPIIQPPVLTPEQEAQLKEDMANDVADKMKNPKPISTQFNA